MENWLETFASTKFRIYDHSNIEEFGGEPFTAMSSFAIDDALGLSVSDGATPAMRLWVHDPVIVLGIADSRLPQLGKAHDFAKRHAHDVIVRNSGGLAVVLDRNVLNISLIMPGSKHLSIHEGYNLMVEFIRHMLGDLTEDIEAYEIVGSYCPGEYDLSIGGRKFAGISQRRVKEGVAVQIYLDATGDSAARASLVRDFYELAAGDEPLRNPPPEVRPETMASLSELIGTKLTADMLAERAINSLRELSSGVVSESVTETEDTDFQKRLALMKKRNEVLDCHKSDN